MSYLQQLIPAINHPLLRIPLRRILWIEDYKHPVVKLTPNACHVYLGEGKYKAILYVNNQYDEAARLNLGWLLSFLHAFDVKAANRIKPAWNLGFDSYSSQPDETDGIDSWLNSGDPGTNNDISSLWIGEHSVFTSKRRTTIKFVLASIGDGAEISAATLSLWQNEARSNNARTFRVFRLKRAWVETEVTWNIYSTGNS